MLALLDISDFRRLWVSQLASSFGTWLMVIAVPLYAFDLTGSTVATGGAFIAETLPALMMGPAAGVLVDRVDRRILMIAADVIRAAAVLSMLAVQSPADLWVLYLALFVENGAAQLFRPARQALIPALIGANDRLAAANAMFAVIDGLVRLVGSVVGGLLYLGIGFAGLVIVDTVSYLISALGCLLIRHRSPARNPTGVTLRAGVNELRTGLSYLRISPTLRGLLAVTGVFYLANGALTALLVPFARAHLHLDATAYGQLLAGLGLGYLIGAPAARAVIDRHSPRVAVLGSIPVLTVSFVLAFESHWYPVSMAGFALAGAPAVILLVAVQTEYQRRTPSALVGRVASAFLTVEMAVSVTGAAIGSTVAQRIGVMPVIDACILILGVLGALAPSVLPARDPVGHLPRRARARPPMSA